MLTELDDKLVAFTFQRLPIIVWRSQWRRVEFRAPGGAMTAAVVEVVVVLVVGSSGVVVRTSDYLFDTCCLLRLS